MKSQILKQAWEIWILPLVIHQVFASVVLTSFIALKYYIQGNDNAVDISENLITFTLFSSMLTVCYCIKNRYERIKQVNVRQRIKRFMLFFYGVYVIYSVIIIIEIVKELSQQP